MQARLSQTVAPVALNASGTGGSAGALWFPGGMPFVSLGYRADRVAFGFGPTLARYEYDVSASQTTALTLVVVTGHVEIDMAQSDDRKNELYFLGALSLMIPSIDHANGSNDDDGISGKVAFSFLGGIGGRHWISHNFGIHVEIAESVASAPIGKVSSSATTYGTTTSSPTDGRATILSTVGSLGVTFVL